MARRITAGAYHNPENIEIMGMSLSPVQLGIGALALGGVGYLVYTNYIAAPVEEAPVEGIQQISLAMGQEATAETVSEEEVATPVVMPELTKAEWLKKIKSSPEMAEMRKAQQDGRYKVTMKISKVAVVKKPTTFFAHSPKNINAPLTPVSAVPNVDQILTVERKIVSDSRNMTSKVYWLARADQSVIFLGPSLITPTSTVKVGKDTQFVPVGLSGIGTKEDLSAEGLAEVNAVLKDALKKVTALKELKKKSFNTSPKIESVYTLTGETVLGVDVKAKKGTAQPYGVARVPPGMIKGAKLFQPGDRVVKYKWKGLNFMYEKYAGGGAVVIAAADGKITPVRIEQPVTIKGISMQTFSRHPTAPVSRVVESTEISMKPTIATRNRARYLGDLSDVIPVKDEERAEEHYTLGNWLSLAFVAALGISAHAYMMKRGLY